MNQPASILLVGASGALGSRIDALADKDDRFRVVARITRSHPHAHARALAHENREIIVDFSHFDAIADSIDLARTRGAPLLIGTTGLDREHLEALERLAADVPVLVAPNTSVGCVVLVQMVRKISCALGENFSPSIAEWHRSGKRDAPSGTANALKRAIEHADDGAVRLGDQAVVSVRAGSIVGEHVVRFDGPDETIELKHTAHSRDLFARGALRAAAWLVDQQPGSYDMVDALGLRDEESQNPL
ncbi:MAG: 4-hydroxy-tetrahydrodipicolinate reductase [Phycisphaerales bacterium]|jgi:4-hydroxy-tetrahydrodipicolinate reductase